MKNNVIAYINNQEIHHQKKSFKDEYVELLKQFNIDYNEAYLFHWIDLNGNVL
jgi:putative transposase